MIRPREVINTDISALSLPGDMLKDSLAPHVAWKDCEILTRVCKQWLPVFRESLDEKLWDRVVFDNKKWREVKGVEFVSDDPVLTPAEKLGLINKLKKKCDFFNEPDNIQAHRFQKSTENRFWHTHMVILFPEEINGEPVDINRMDQLFSFVNEKNTGTAFDYISGHMNEEYRNRPLPRTYFAMVSLDVIPGSRATYHTAKENLLKPKGCRAPTPLEGVITNLVVNLGKKEGYFFGREGKFWTCTATDELFQGYRLVVGGASSAGPGVYSNDDDDSGSVGHNCGVGVAAVAEVL